MNRRHFLKTVAAGVLFASARFYNPIALEEITPEPVALEEEDPLGAFMPNILSAGIKELRRNCIMPRLVYIPESKKIARDKVHIPIA